ncbi:hypothetical protein Poli38472_007921 [Pythium oligandrum]|uniref:Tesmin/TSO1-like CXC domain-containing protein n=1 Tax=Pythium oligandrum TaxID=41045 RepID=A0A8K1FLI0_PYTOL|nr:hypothetical protein Poli38472_007921 [Pythium oligandrum]|eukprot:TMW65279.1 hypothetical protein Poli38472_007921 [Pythium oligandrum]
MESSAPPADADEMQRMWQFLDSTLSSGSTPNGAPPSAPSAPVAQAAMPPAAATEAPPLTDDDNGMYNELGDVFNMFFHLDTDDAAAQHANGAVAAPSAGHLVDPNAKVQLPRTTSSGSSLSEGISPGLGYPSMSPATMNWLQSLANSASSESLTGLVSPATLTFGQSGSAGGLSVLDGSSSSGSAQGGLPRSPSCEMIDWKAYNETYGAAEKTQKEPPKWRVIPQHGPHADPSATAAASYPANKPPPASAPAALNEGVDDGGGGLRSQFITRPFQTIKSTVASIVGAALSGDVTAVTGAAQPVPHQHPQVDPASSNGVPPVVLPPEIQQQYELAAKRMAEDKNKRKAIISPEYVQYGTTSSGVTTSSELPMGSVPPPYVGGIPDPIKYEPSLSGSHPQQYATQVADPSGRRPSKKSLHHAGPLSPTGSTQSRDDTVPGGPVRCKCTGKCRNARCACVKAGFVCGVHCKCVSCANPFVPMEREGINIQTMVNDVCLMQYLSKVKDMQELLDSTVPYDCCDGVVQVKFTVEKGFTCPTCQAHYTYSWCSHRLCHDQKKPRKHCAKCRRCGDHRNEHCDDCNHCYFAGVANSFSCSCKTGGKGGSLGSGVKSRSVVASLAGSGDEAGPSMSPTSSTTSKTDTGGSASHEGNASSSSGNGGAKTMSEGLSSNEAEKDDACPVQ